jgi:hypothetical protein
MSLVRGQMRSPKALALVALASVLALAWRYAARPLRGPRFCGGVEVLRADAALRLLPFPPPQVLSESATQLAAPPFVFVHLGEDALSFPDFIAVAVAQVALWNPGAEVHLVVPRRFLARPSVANASAARGAHVRTWAAEDVPRGPLYDRFLRESSMDAAFRGGFWRAAAERLFVVADLMAAVGVDEALHLENDNLVYFRATALLPKLRARYAGLAATPLSDEADGFRVTAGFFYIGRRGALEDFLRAVRPGEGANEMCMLGAYARLFGPAGVSFLPVLPPEDELRLPDFTRHVSALGGIFDAAAHGQYLGGPDPWHKASGGISFGKGFVNWLVPYRVDEYEYEWRRDLETSIRRVYLRKRGSLGAWQPIFVLHIHCKDLAAFAS